MKSTRQTPNEVYASIIAGEMQAEASRKQSIEQRGLSVITTSGALMTFLLALFSAKPFERLSDTPIARVALIFAAAALAFAEVAGLASQAPMDYQFFGDKDLVEMVSEVGWREGAGIATWRVAQTQAKFISSNRRKNTLKARMVQFALALEVLGLACLSVALIGVTL